MNKHPRPETPERTGDEALLSALNEGSEEAFDAIYGKYWRKVFAVCHRHTRSSETSRELTQDIFKSLWERRGETEIAGPLEHYLHRSAKYQVFNFFRAAGIRQRHAEAEARGSESAKVHESAEERLELFQLSELAEKLVNGLPAPCRAVFRLRHDGELSHEEIARTMNISVKTVEYHMGNARKRIRRGLAPWMDSPA